MSPGTDGPASSSRKGLEDAASLLGAEAGARPAAEWAGDLAARAAASEKLAESVTARLTTLDGSQSLLDQMVQRWSGTATGQFAGRFFEYQQATTFNMSAAAQQVQIRALVTEFEGLRDPHAAADLTIVDSWGRTLSEAQAKAVSSTAQRVHGLASDRYAGMALVTPIDHAGHAAGLIDRRMAAADPTFLKRDAYESVLNRIDDRLRHGPVAAEPISSEGLRDAARDPYAFAGSLRGREESALRDALAEAQAVQEVLPLAQLLEVAGAAGLAGLSAASVSALVHGVAGAARVRAGEISPTAAAVSTAASAASAFGRGAFTGGLGAGLKVASETGVLPDALGGGALPYAVARATWEVGAVGVLLARGEITGPEAGARTAGSLTRVGFAYGGMVVGQALIPIPGVGALIGGTVGSLCAALTVQGLTLAHASYRELGLDREHLARLEVEIAAALVVLDAETQWLRESAIAWDIAFTRTVIPALDDLRTAMLAGDVTAALPATVVVISAFGQAPLFSTMSEFDGWMGDPGTGLHLNPNPRRTALHES